MQTDEDTHVPEEKGEIWEKKTCYVFLMLNGIENSLVILAQAF